MSNLARPSIVGWRHLARWAPLLGVLELGLACGERLEPEVPEPPSFPCADSVALSSPPSPAQPAEPVEGEDPVVVLLTLDGARWQEVFLGTDIRRTSAEACREGGELMPHLHQLLRTHGAAVGAPGAPPMSASGPEFISLPGYLELFTGYPSACRSNDCGQTTDPTVFDALASSPGRPTDVVAISSWPAIERAVAVQPERVALSTGQHGGVTRGVFERSPWAGELLSEGEEAGSFPGYGDFRRDHVTAALGLAALEHWGPRLLFVGLGEPDEFAHRNNYDGYLASLRSADEWIGRFAEALNGFERQGRPTLLMVTSDHGRAEGFVEHGGDYPESARTWLVAAGSLVRARGWVLSPTERHLSDITPTLRHVFGLAQVSAPGAGTVLTELGIPSGGDATGAANPSVRGPVPAQSGFTLPWRSEI